MSAISVNISAWQGWVLGSDLANGSDSFPASFRRRVTPIGKVVLNAAHGFPETKDARFVLSSRHGEFSRTLSLLKAITSNEELSPADFTLSVHHALLGLLSIAHKNYQGHTAVAAGDESFYLGLLEAAACIIENPKRPVVYLYFDEPLSGAYSRFNENTDQPIVLALVIGAEGGNASIRLDIDPLLKHEKKVNSHARDFLQFLQNGESELISVCGHTQWRWTKHASI